MEFQPKVSLIIPVYNGSNYLNQSINSALDQTYKNLEIIVVNDGSKDNGKTDEIARSYGTQIKYFPKENGGVASALNYGIEKMTGEYFSWLSHDDVYFSDKIESQINFLKTLDNKFVILFGDWQEIGSNSEVFGNKIIPHNKTLKPYYPVMNCLINGCTLLIPKKCFNDVGGFDVNLPTTQDYDLWFRMAGKYKFIHLPGVHVKYRIHLEQDSIKHPSHLAEENSLHTGFVKSLSENEILQIERTLPLFYLKRAIFYKNVYKDAEAFSIQKYAETKHKGIILHKPYILFLFFLYKNRGSKWYVNTINTLKILINPLKWNIIIRKVFLLIKRIVVYFLR